MVVAGIQFPCVDCWHVHQICRKRNEIFKKVFFSIGNGKPVPCSDYEEERFHGLEGVRA